LVRPKTYDPTAKALAGLAAIAAIAPMVGFLAGADNLLYICIGIANKRPAATSVMLAPGLAKTAPCVTLGLLAGTIAVVGRHHPSLLQAGGNDARDRAMRPTRQIT
jgi:biopolymer transport protein ExbB/TolQ